MEDRDRIEFDRQMRRDREEERARLSRDVHRAIQRGEMDRADYLLGVPPVDAPDVAMPPAEIPPSEPDPVDAWRDALLQGLVQSQWFPLDWRTRWYGMLATVGSNAPTTDRQTVAAVWQESQEVAEKIRPVPNIFDLGGAAMISFDAEVAFAAEHLAGLDRALAARQS